MDALNSTTELLKQFDGLISIFDGGDPEPFSNRQERRVNSWKGLLVGDGNSNARSKTRQFVRSQACKTALKIRELAGVETLMLWMLKYSITGLPKITYNGFYRMLQEWSLKTKFPDMPKAHASNFGMNLRRTRTKHAFNVFPTTPPFTSNRPRLTLTTTQR